MTSRERVLRTFDRLPTDRVPMWCGASPEFMEKAQKHLNVDSDELVYQAFHDDFRRVYSRFVGPAEKGGRTTVFGVSRDGIGFGQPCTHPLKDATIEQVEAYEWPNPDWFDVSHIREDALAYGGEYAIMGGEWCPFFHDCIDLMGMENMMINMYINPHVVAAIIQHIVDYYVALTTRIFEAAGDVIDIFFIGNDFGSQTGPLLNIPLFDQFCVPHLTRLADLAHQYDMKFMIHCCGSFTQLIPSMIRAGVDAVQSLQPTTPSMDIVNLVETFGDKMVLNGGVNSVKYLIEGTVEETVAETKRVLKAASAGGFILSPSHDYLLIETKVENVLAMYNTAL